MVVNTCAVTNEASRKSKKRLRDLHKGQPQCQDSRHRVLRHPRTGDTIQENLHVDMVVSNGDKATMAKRSLTHGVMICLKLAESSEVPTGFCPNSDTAFVKVQDGCHNRCSFCIVSTARGAERSIPIQDVVKDIQNSTSGWLSRGRSGKSFIWVVMALTQVKTFGL